MGLLGILAQTVTDFNGNGTATASEAQTAQGLVCCFGYNTRYQEAGVVVMRAESSIILVSKEIRPKHGNT